MALNADAHPPIVIGEHLALDFLNSKAVAREAGIDWIRNGQALLAWMQALSVVSVDERELLESANSREALDDLALEASELREWFRNLLARSKDFGAFRLTAEEAERLNRIIGLEGRFHCVEVNEHGVPSVAWRTKRSSLRAVLAPLASAAASLLAFEPPALVRRCGNPACTLWFVDRTKAHRRKWCSPAYCGNRAKVAAYRQRRSPQASPEIPD